MAADVIQRNAITPVTTQLPISYEISVEETEPNIETAFPPIAAPTSTGKLYFSTIMALVIAILGSSVLPMAYAFARTGIMLGLCVAFVVALTNTYTCGLLLDAAQRTGKHSYEELTQHVGGKPLMAFTQWSNIILLFGNLVGDMCLLADLGSKSLTNILGDDAPRFLVEDEGRWIMVVLTCSIIFPLSLLRGLRALEYVSSAGVLVLLVLATIVTYKAASVGLVGITSGEVPLWGVNLTDPHIPEAFALIGFSFYLHPLMMPLLQELPPGKEGIQVAWTSVKLVIMVVAMVVICYIGIMGAAAFGAHTAGDIMMNQLIANRVGAASLVVAVLIYISSCIPPLVVSMRCYIDFMVAGPHAGFRRPRFVLETVTIVFTPMLVAMWHAGASRAAYAVTGATGVCVVCYVVPVIVNAMLRRQAAQHYVRASACAEPLLQQHRDIAAPTKFSMRHDVLPWAVLLFGCVLSVLALKGIVYG